MQQETIKTISLELEQVISIVNALTPLVAAFSPAVAANQQQIKLGTSAAEALIKIISAIPVAGSVTQPELWDGDRQGYLKSMPTGDVLFLENVMMSLDSWPSVFRITRCKTVLPESHLNLSLGDHLSSVDEELLTLLPYCPPRKYDRIIPTKHNMF